MRPAFDLDAKHVLVIGLARTGLATALFCAARGAQVTAIDEKCEESLATAAAQLRRAGVRLFFGAHPGEALALQDLVIPSPGVPVSHLLLLSARAAGVPVWSEIELAWRFLRGRLVAITGSNGKTTTAALTAHILRTAGMPVLLGGNIGMPLISLVDSSSDSSITVAEISSFQLEWISAFRPDIAVLLNITPDHLDRHGSLETYARAKARIFENQRERDAAVLNADDPAVTPLAPARPRVFWFSRQTRVADGAFTLNGHIAFRARGEEETLLSRQDIRLRGAHNLENVLASAAAARLAGATPSDIARGVRTFAAVEHRLEFVAEIGGVKFYNDSKATNVEATLKAIEAFDEPLLVILGGKDKGSAYTPLREPLARSARRVLVIGAAAEKIARELGESVPVEHAGTLDRAVRAAWAHAQPGDVILLAPACASFDQFENFEHRGRVFKELVAELARRAALPGAPLRAERMKHAS
jgi:UDP-N-acetylmuramoylalanine--D-glutamate ligase